MTAVASIDIGTNTLRLFIAEREEDGTLRPVCYVRVVARLGGGYTEEAGIASVAAERALKALEGFRGVMDKHHARLERAVATSVVRRAVNRQWFIAEARRRAAIDIDVIGGAEEAALSVAGVNSVILTDKPVRLIVDIGGGSTEFVVVEHGEIVFSESLEMGVVHLSEDYQRSDPPMRDELSGMENEIRVAIEGLKKSIRESGLGCLDGPVFDTVEFIGTAGTFTTIAAIDLELETYDSERINNHEVDRTTLQALYARISGLSLNERKDILSLENGREDLIIPGIIIVLNIMYVFGFLTVKVSDAGLLEGLLLTGPRREETQEEVF